MPAGIGGGGYVLVALETTNGTYVQPGTASDVYVPILDETFKYTSEPYFSPQLRQQTIVSDVKQGYYHVEGDIHMEVDPRFLPYFMYASRHLISKSGAGPYVYTFAPGSQGSTSTAATGLVQRTMSVTISRNNVLFGYAGCTCGGYEFTIEDGVVKVTLNMLGLSDNVVTGTPAPAWVAPDLFGADASQVSVAASGTAPTFGAASMDYNGYTFRSEFGAEPQNRIRRDRSASYISFGETVANLETELDFISRTEYDNFVATTQRAVLMESINPGTGTFATATSGLQIQANRMVWEEYDLGLAGIGDLIMAGVNGRSIGIAGGDAYKIVVKSPTNIA
jgi:hypothetical protein